MSAMVYLPPLFLPPPSVFVHSFPPPTPSRLLECLTSPSREPPECRECVSRVGDTVNILLCGTQTTGVWECESVIDHVRLMTFLNRTNMDKCLAKFDITIQPSWEILWSNIRSYITLLKSASFTHWRMSDCLMLLLLNMGSLGCSYIWHVCL